MSETWQSIHDRVEWWLNDMAFKPPELLTQHYFECMANDIADWATGEETLPGSMDRLDPPRSSNVH